MAPSCSQGVQAATQGARGWTWTSALTPQEHVDDIRPNRGKNMENSGCVGICVSYVHWLVVYLPSWKIWKSMGRMTSHRLWKIKAMFQTTNQFHMFMLVLCVWCQKPRRFRSCLSWWGFFAGDKSWNMFGTCSGNAFCTQSSGVWAKLGFFFENLWEKSGHSKVVTLQWISLSAWRNLTKSLVRCPNKSYQQKTRLLVD